MDNMAEYFADGQCPSKGMNGRQKGMLRSVWVLLVITVTFSATYKMCHLEARTCCVLRQST